MVRRSWILLTSAVFMGMIALVSVTGCAQAQEEARAQESDTEEGEQRFTFAFGGGSYLGVYLSDVDAEDVSELGLKAERGALVESVADESPAAESGIEANDVILTWNDTPIESVAQLTRLVRETPAGRTVELGVMRDGRQRDIDVTVRKRSRQGYAYRIGPQMERAREAYGRALGRVEGLRDRFDAEHVRSFFTGRPRLGVSLQNLTPQLGEFFGIDTGEGALVTSVSDDSPAAKAGLRAGDVIVSVDGEAVEGPGGVMRAISKRDEGEVEITVMRDKKRRTISATLEKVEEGAWQGSGSHFYISPGSESVYLDLPHTIVLPSMPDVDIPDIVIPDMPDVEIRTIRAERLAPTAL
jgi:C-terminal processing protease CtpA/Prc